jgi:SH3-like domain-containing protein
MSLNQIQTALAEVCQPYADTRLHHCRVEATNLENNHCALTGTVLDADTYAHLTAALAERFPQLTFDVSNLQVLRRPEGQLLTVATNLTSLHLEPNFQAEMMSQLLNGIVVEQLMENGRWVFVRLMDGYLGWTYRPYLSDLPPAPSSHVVSRPLSLLYCQPSEEAELASRVVAGTAVPVLAQEDGWVQVALAGGREGWLLLTTLRSLDEIPQTADEQRAQMMRDAKELIGVPYLWGGGSALGIDCSGYVQLLHRLAGVTIPRDADMQYAAGRPVEPPFQPGDLFFFSGEGGHRAITHVGMSLGGWRMIHSSRSRNGVYEDDLESASWLKQVYVGARRFLGD